MVKLLSVCVCLSAWILTRVTHILTTAHRLVILHRPTNELSGTKTQVGVTYFTGENPRNHQKVGVNRHF